MNRGGQLGAPFVLLVLFTLFSAFSFATFFGLGGGRVSGDGSYRVQAVMPTAVALAPGAEVRTAGVKVGRVHQIASRAGRALVLFDLDERHAPVRRDARVRVRLKSLVGENYLELDPGTPAAGTLQSGGVLALTNSDEATQLDEILSTLDRTTRRELQAAFDGLGNGLDGHGPDLNDTFASVSGVVQEGTPLVQVLDHRRRQAAELIDSLGAVMRAVGDRGTAIRLLAARSKVVARAVASRDAALARTIDELPSTLAQARRTTRHLGRFSVKATPAIASLRSALTRLTPVVARLPRAAARTRRSAAELSRFAPRGGPLLTELRRFSTTALTAVPTLDEMFGQLVPLLGYLAPRAKDLIAFFGNQRSASNDYDATGHVARLQVLVGPSSPAFTTPTMKAALDALFKAGALSKIRTAGSNPYPSPGRVGQATAFAGKYARLQALPGSRDQRLR